MRKAFTLVELLVVITLIAVIIGGAFLGVNNTLITTAVMQSAPVDRPVASAAYSFIRFVGGGAAPFLAGILAESFVPSIPFYVGAAAVFASIAILFSGRAYLSKV